MQGHDKRLKNQQADPHLSNSHVPNGLTGGGFKPMPSVINQKNFNDAIFGKDSVHKTNFSTKTTDVHPREYQ